MPADVTKRDEVVGCAHTSDRSRRPHVKLATSFEIWSDWLKASARVALIGLLLYSIIL